MVRLLDRQPAVPFGTRRTRTLHDRHPAAERDRHAAHGAHAQQHVAQAGRLVRLGAHLLHDGRTPHRERHQGILRPLRERQDLPRRTHGQLGSRGADGAVGRRGGIQGVARQALLPALPGRRLGQGGHRRHDAPRNDPGRHGAVRQPQRPALRLAAGRGARHRTAGEPRNPRNPRRIRRHRVRYGRAESDPGARRERLHAGREIQPRGDRHL